MCYQVNDMVIYGTAGVCRITDISEQSFGEQQVRYYILQPVYDSNSTVFVPVGNESLTSKMHRILSAEEIYDLIRTMPEEDPNWTDNEAVRRENYKDIIRSGDRREIIRMIKALYSRQQKLLQNGKKKLHASDERFLKEAERMLHEEFAHVLNIQRDQVLPFILEQIQVETKN